MESLEELLPGIEDYLSNVLAKEKLSSFAEKKRQYYLERLDVLKLPPSLPPRPEDLVKVSQLTSPFLEQQRALSNKPLNIVELTAEDGEVYEDVVGTSPSDTPGIELANGDLDEDLYMVPLAGQDVPPEEEFTSTDYETYDEDEEETEAPVYVNTEPPLREKPRTGRKEKTNSITDSIDSGVRDLSARSLKNVAYCGDLQQRIKNKWQKQFCVILSDGSLLCYKNEKDAKPLLDITLLGYDVLFMEKDQKRNNVIRLSHPARKTYWFSADNKDKSEPWLQVIQTMANSSDISGGSLTGSSSKTEFDSSSHGAPSHVSDTHSMTSSEGGSGDGVVQHSQQPPRSPQPQGKMLPIDKRKQSTTIMDSLSNFFSVGRKKGKQMATALTIDEKNIDPDAILAAYLQILADMTGRKWSSRICVLKPGLLQVYKETSETIVEKTISLLGCTIERSQDSKRQLALTLNIADKESIQLDYQDRIEQGRWLTFLIRETRMGDQSGETEYLYVDDKEVPEEDEDVYDDIYDEVGNHDPTEPSITSLLSSKDCKDSELLTSITNFIGRNSGGTEDSPPPLPASQPPPLPTTNPPKKSLVEVGPPPDSSHVDSMPEDDAEYDDIGEMADQVHSRTDEVLVLEDATVENESSTDAQDGQSEQSYENINSYLESRGIIPIDDDSLTYDIPDQPAGEKAPATGESKSTVGKLDLSKFPFQSNKRKPPVPLKKKIPGDYGAKNSHGKEASPYSLMGGPGENLNDSKSPNMVLKKSAQGVQKDGRQMEKCTSESIVSNGSPAGSGQSDDKNDETIYQNIECEPKEVSAPPTDEIYQNVRSESETEFTLTVSKSGPGESPEGGTPSSKGEPHNVYSKVRVTIDEPQTAETSPTFSSELTIPIMPTMEENECVDINQNKYDDENEYSVPCDVILDEVTDVKDSSKRKNRQSWTKKLPAVTGKLKKPPMPLKRMTLKMNKNTSESSSSETEKKKTQKNNTSSKGSKAVSGNKSSSSSTLDKPAAHAETPGGQTSPASEILSDADAKPRAGIQRSPVITKTSRDSWEARANLKVKSEEDGLEDFEEREICGASNTEKKHGYIEVIESDIEEVKRKYSPNVSRKTEMTGKKEVQTVKARSFTPDIKPVKFSTSGRFSSPAKSGSPSAVRKAGTAGQSHTNGSSIDESESIEVIKCHQGPTIEADKEILGVTTNPILSQLRKEKGIRRSFKQTKREKMEDDMAGLKRKLIQIRKKKSQVRSSKLNAADLREKKVFDEQLRQLEREYNENEAKLNKLKTEYEENIFMDSISQEDDDSSLSDSAKSFTLPATRSTPSPTRQKKTSTLPATTRNGVSTSSSPRKITPPSVTTSPGLPRRRSEPFTDTKFTLDSSGSITLEAIKREIKVTKSYSSGGTKAVRDKALNINLREQGAGADRDPSPRGGRQMVQEKLKLWEQMANSTSDC